MRAVIAGLAMSIVLAACGGPRKNGGLGSSPQSPKPCECTEQDVGGSSGGKAGGKGSN